jgi:2-phosphosulfolactate phosphatase
VDVIRATTSLCIFFEYGCNQVLVAPSVAAARAARTRLGPRWVLAGEVGGARPDDFDLGNSPAEIAGAALAGRDVLFATTNGTRALHACTGGHAIFAGSFRNAAAVATTALATLSEENARAPIGEPEDPQPDIVVVCAGRDDKPTYDDTLCAGYLVRKLTEAAHAMGRDIILRENAPLAFDAAAGAEALWGYRNALARSEAARAIARIGLSGDLDWCAATNVTQVVPQVTGVDASGELLIIEPTSMLA